LKGRIYIYSTLMGDCSSGYPHSLNLL
jgi:hypothetical protein